MAKDRSHAKKVVDAKFLNKLADEIYDPKDKSFIRLCTGTLQNGPDPVDGKRTMHCGLGELYFKLTGRQPETDHVDEEGVVEECLTRSALNPEGKREAVEETLRKTLKKELGKLKLAEHQVEDMIDVAVDGIDDDEFETPAQEFRDLLNEIPDVNDNTGDATGEDEEGKSTCSEADFLERSKAVAAILRKAAALLPA